jgi:Transposase DDE domain
MPILRRKVAARRKRPASARGLPGHVLDLATRSPNISAVDAKHKMIIEQAVTNDVLDMGLLRQTAEPARQLLDVDTIDVVADKGYFKSEDIEACENVGLTPHVPYPQRGTSVREGFFRKDEFRYDAGRDVYICPAEQMLTPIRQGRLRDLKKIDYSNPKACLDCPLRARCTNDIRSVSRLENEDALESNNG